MKLILGVSVVLHVADILWSIESYNYENMKKFGQGFRPIPGVRRQLDFINKYGYEYPQPIEDKKDRRAMGKAPYPSIVQGKRVFGDVRVLRKSFSYPAYSEPHKMYCEDLLYCTISYISVETTDGIPFILRGGAGYQHFSIAVRSTPGSALSGTIKVFCLNTDNLIKDNGTEHSNQQQ